MNYLQTHSRSNARRTKIISIFFCVLVIFALILGFAPHFFPAVFTSIARPFWRTEFSVASGSMTSPAALLNENESLKRSLADAQIRLQTIQSIENENIELKNILGRASTTPRILAAVLKRPPLSTYDELIIDIGQDKNLSTTSTVYAAGNILIGKVSDVLGQTAKVTLFSSPGQKYDVMIGNAHTSAVAIGRGGGQYEAQLPRDVKVLEGDYVSAPALNDRAFGIVTAVLANPADPFETVLFAPPVNIYTLRWVMVDVRGK